MTVKEKFSELQDKANQTWFKFNQRSNELHQPENLHKDLRQTDFFELQEEWHMAGNKFASFLTWMAHSGAYWNDQLPDSAPQ